MTKLNLRQPATDSEEANRKNNIRVLHVDDEAGLLTCAKQILEMQGPFQVDSASCVEEALAKMRANQYDVIVSDYQMPIKDGLQFLKELRNSGLGLHLVKLMCEVYGWTINETGTQGKGAQFTITIPKNNYVQN